MWTSTVKIVLVLIGSLGAACLLIYGYVTYWFATKQIWRELAQDVTISPHWLEIFPRPSLKAKRHVQGVYLAIEGYEPDLIAPLSPITLKDGTELNPEIEILDEFGKVYDLKGRSRIGNLIGFSAIFLRTGITHALGFVATSLFGAQRSIGSARG